jgi:hypothetical protein
MSLIANKLALVSTILVCFAGGIRAADSLSWNAEKGQVTADVQTWDLRALLESIATATGWEIYVEPKTRHNASTKFKERPPGEALRLLLGNLSYVLVPQTNGPGKLYVFKNTRNDATQLVKGRKKSKKLDKELIVTMKPGAKLDAEGLGAKVTGKIDKLNAYRLEFDSAEAAEKARQKLEQDENVDLVDSNFELPRPQNPDSLSMSSIPGLELNIKPNQAGDGPIIGLLDTAVQGKSGFYLPGMSVAGEANVEFSDSRHGHGRSDPSRIGTIEGYRRVRRAYSACRHLWRCSVCKHVSAHPRIARSARAGRRCGQHEPWQRRWHSIVAAPYRGSVSEMRDLSCRCG